ncbi:facilitated trehalose transporter Tret1-2 homolog [Tribolium castaneum]|uniref:Facilitated trehalose transporter Tret1-2 homolog-like Protein n=1 Tax=Tribolium castaneum TaxID=7070 RepID=D7EK15_TRICA|nr:PREDICTED: facilitated trehalose transporter Tret1-2 homolog [Tribolium castaneum]EFA12961.1 Facilitated trehalose transporter Tret1-2 homolog-like Protein [Tribolium castaneum]|eukprot:XP_008200409.1 PREDICTED: facilitated trehalose transporter Tret1-2 homolog [Tribolium castaneum]
MTTKEEYEYTPVAGTEESETTFNVTNGEVTIQSNKMTSESAEPTNRKFLYVAACVANLAGFVCGTSFGWTSPEIPKMKISHEAGNPLALALTKSEESWIGSLLPVGATLGPFIAGLTADKIGRKNTLLAGTVPFIVAFAIAAYATNPLLFFLMRFLCGLAVGVVFTVLPMYIGEIAEDEVRDSLGSFMQLFIVVGLLFSYALGPYMSIMAFNIACVVSPCVFLVVFYLFIPESPYFLIRENKDQAAQALMKLRSKSEEAIQEELEEIKASVEETLANKASFADIFKSKGLTKALTISVGLVSLQQLSGINIVLFYAQDIFTDAGSTIPADISTIIIGIVQVFASGATPIVVEKKGKRYLLLLSAVGMAVSQGALAVFFHVKSGGSDVSAISWLPVTCLVVYIITYCLGFGPLPWAVMGELFPGNIKSVASTVTAAGCWFLGFILTKYFSLVSDLIGQAGSFGIFAACCVGAGVFVYKYLPDTSGKSLQEIQDMLSGKSSSSDA